MCHMPLLTVGNATKKLISYADALVAALPLSSTRDLSTTPHYAFAGGGGIISGAFVKHQSASRYGPLFTYGMSVNKAKLFERELFSFLPSTEIMPWHNLD